MPTAVLDDFGRTSVRQGAGKAGPRPDMRSQFNEASAKMKPEKSKFPSSTTMIVLAVLLLVVVLTCVPYLVTIAFAQGEASPIFGVTVPEGYKQWELIAPAEE